MAYVYTILIIFVVGFVCYRMIKKKSTPSNKFTPYDDITMGITGNFIQSENLIQDTKHHIPYEENADSDKTV